MSLQSKRKETEIACVAINYARDSDNRIHSDEYAARYGFKGGLVPGVGDFAYLTRPALEFFGSIWLSHAEMSAKFIKPVYHGETMMARARIESADDDVLSLRLVNRDGVTCAVGRASLGLHTPPPSREDYGEISPPDIKPEPSPGAFNSGRVLSPLSYRFNQRAQAQAAAEKFADPSPLYTGANPLWHPALCLHEANLMLRNNVNLGPWIHTASNVTYFDQPRDGESLIWVGTVIDTYLKRGNVATEVDLALFGEDERSLLRVHHCAIISLRDTK